jgi:hypothetical protein
MALGIKRGMMPECFVKCQNFSKVPKMFPKCPKCVQNDDDDNNNNNNNIIVYKLMKLVYVIFCMASRYFFQDF